VSYPRCGMHAFEARLVGRSLTWRLLIALRPVAPRLSLQRGSVVKMPASNEPDELSLALDLLRKILKHGTNHNRRYCIYCKVSMRVPIELHKQVVCGAELGSW